MPGPTRASAICLSEAIRGFYSGPTKIQGLDYAVVRQKSVRPGHFRLKAVFILPKDTCSREMLPHNRVVNVLRFSNGLAAPLFCRNFAAQPPVRHPLGLHLAPSVLKMNCNGTTGPQNELSVAKNADGKLINLQTCPHSRCEAADMGGNQTPRPCEQCRQRPQNRLF